MNTRLYMIIAFCSVLTLTGGMISNTAESYEKNISHSQVRYSVLSQRWLTKEELLQFEDAQGVVLAVRLRLSNEGKQHIMYLATSGTIVPTGYHLFRSIGTSAWKSTSPGRGREGPPGSEFTGVAYSWLELPPGSVVEVEAHDWSNPGEEHAFSTFVKTDINAKPSEIVSDTYRPLVK